MNYEKLYFAFIEKYKNQVFEDGVYTEVHHIIPRHAGGDDSKENLVRLTYKQHVFAHLMLWKAYDSPKDKIAYKLMTSLNLDKVRFLRSEFGKIQGDKNREAMSILGKQHGPVQGRINVESGLLDEIRPLANNEAQREHARNFAKARMESGELFDFIKLAQDAWRGSHHTEEFKQKRSEDYKKMYAEPENRERLLSNQKKAIEKRKQDSLELSNTVIENAERNEEYLHKCSSVSKNVFVSPEGLEFDSPIYAAKYYGNVEYYVIENWCKRNKHGWKRKPKAEQA